MYGILGSSLDVRCVTETEPSRYYWLTKNSNGDVTIATRSGVTTGYIDVYELIRTGNRDISLRIKNVALNEPQVWCRVHFTQSDGTLGPGQLSSTSNITVIGKSNNQV